MSERLTICPADELDTDSARRFDVDGHRIAVIRLGDEFYAIGDRCSHADYSLAEGEIDAADKTLECWKHGSAFSLETGEPVCLPATKPVPVYKVDIVGGVVTVIAEENANG